jgi:hypothetical protein
MRYSITLFLIGAFLCTNLAFGQKIMKRKGNLVLFNVSSSSALNIGDVVKVTQSDGSGFDNEVGSIKIVKLQNGRGVGKITAEKNGTIQAGDQLMNANGFGESAGTDFSHGGSPLGRGSWLVSGTGGFSSFGGDLYSLGTDERSTSIDVSTNISYFLMQGLAVGGILGYSGSAQGEESTSMLGIGPQVSFFFGGSTSDPAKGKLYPFVNGAFLYGRQTMKSTYLDESYESTHSSTSIILGGGAMYMLTNSAGLVGEATYQIDTYSHDGSSISGNSINFLVGIAASLY